ncbi:MAG: protein kinase [Acidobacteriota bacterium]|nr:protein kinase [Acidobacteriota bacterium]
MPSPSTISRYEIKRELGRGGMGTLYLALDPLIDRLVAVKLLRVDTEEIRTRFLREARAGGRLQHKNIVTFYDVGVYEDQPFIAFEYVKGETLEEVIGRKATLALDRKLKLIEELCDGLGYAHDAGLIHRDIKPANLMVTEGSGELKVLDFGIARGTEVSGLTQTGAICGTMNYMSPEQAQGRPLDHRSDIFAVGAVLYEILTYRRAFPGNDLQAVLRDTPEPVTQIAPFLDPDLDDIVARALVPDPAHRYQHLRELAERLADLRTRFTRLYTNQQQADLATGELLAEADATQIETYLSSAKTQLKQGHLTNALTLVNRALDVQRTQAGVELQQRVLLTIEDREKKQERTGTVGLSLRAGRENLEKGAFEAAIRAANEVLAYVPDHAEAIELKERALKEGEGRGRVELEATVLQTDRISDPEAREVGGRGRWTTGRWLWPAAAVVAVLTVGALIWVSTPGPAGRAVAEAEALYDAGQRTAAFAQLELFAPTNRAVTEELAELRDRWTQEAEELATQARALADEGDVGGAVAMLRGFAPPHDSITAVLEELEVLDPEAGQSAIARARDLFDNGERQQALNLLESFSPTTPEVQAALALLTASWEEQAEALVLSALTRAGNGDPDGAIAALEDFAPSHEAVRVALAELRGRLGHLEAARRTVDRAARLFEEGERLDAFRILDEFSPSHDLVDEEAQRLGEELDQLADVEVNEARRLAADSSLTEAVDRLDAFAPPHGLVTATLKELRSELDTHNAAQAAIDDAQRLAANRDWSRAFARLQDFTPAALVTDSLQGLRAEWEQDAQAVARQAQNKVDDGDLAGALRELAQFQGDHPAVAAVEAQVTALVNAPPPLERATTDPSVNLEARLLALSNQADGIVARFVELYEDLDADGMSSIWTTASTEDLAPLADTFKNFRSAKVEHQDCDPELRNETRAVVYCSVAVAYQPVAGARLQMPAVGWQFELEWVDERWQMVNWSR